MPPAIPYNATDVLENYDNQDFYASHLGPYLMGLCFQLFMMGILTLQSWNYFEHFTDDLPRYKVLVAFMFLSGAFMCITDIHMLYDSFVSGFGDLIRWDSYTWTFYYEPAWTALIAAVSQSFFLYRCYVFTKSKIILVLGTCFILLALTTACAVSAGLKTAGHYTLTGAVVPLGVVWLLSTAMTDLGLSMVLIGRLWRVDTEFKQTVRSYLLAVYLAPGSSDHDYPYLSRNEIIRLSFETAAFTTVVAVGNLIASFYAQQNTAHLFFQFIIGKMYSHSVMVTLLARKKFRRNDSRMRSIGHIPTRTGDLGCDLEFNHDSSITNDATVTITKSQMSGERTRSNERPGYHDDEPEGGYKMKPLRTSPPSDAVKSQEPRRDQKSVSLENIRQR